MRTLTGQETKVLNAPDGYTVRARVWVLSEDSEWWDVTTLEGRDWLVSVEWDESIDEGCAQATVQLRRKLEELSLNPLVSSKLTGMLDLARPFTIETATIPLGDAPEESDWREVFSGKVTSLDLNQDPITFSGLDDAGALLRNYIEEEREYGSDAGTPLETVIQEILDDNDTGVTLYVPSASSVVLSRFKQKKMAVLLAVRALAMKSGWDVRYWWNSGTSAFRFTLLPVDRAGAAGSQWAFPAWQVKKVTRNRLTLDDIRNAGRLYYYDRDTLDSAGKPTLNYVTSEDAGSIASYERQYMQLSEGEDSPIRSEPEAQTMLDAAIADLKLPLLFFGADVGLHYGVQLRDLLTFPADDENFSSDQTLAVVTVAHRVDRRGHSTSVELRGKPVGAHDGWLKREGRASKQPQASQSDAVSGLAATATVGGATLRFVPPVVSPLPVEYELHLSPTSGFTPDLSASSTTFHAVSASDTFTVSGLDPGVTRYAKVVPKSKTGVYGAVSAEVSFVTRYVEPRTLQPLVTYAALPLNSDFEAHNDPSAPPDAWTFGFGTWGTDASVSTSTTYSGGKAVRLAATSTSGRVTSSIFVVREYDQLLASAVVTNEPQGIGAGQTVSLWVEWLDNAFAYITTSTVGTLGTFSGWATLGGGTPITVPVGARYARLTVGKESAAAYEVFVDSTRVLVESKPAGFSIPTLLNSFSVSGVSVPAYYATSTYRIELSGHVTRTSAPAAGTVIFSMTVAPVSQKRFTVPTNTGAGEVSVETNGDVKYQSGGTGYLSLDGISFRIDS